MQTALILLLESGSQRSLSCFLNYQSLALTPFELLKLLKSRFKKRVSQAGQRRGQQLVASSACGA